MVRAIAVAGLAALLVAHARGEQQLSSDEHARVEAAIRTAFGFLYALPSDTAAARMGSWVLDSAAADDNDPTAARWRIVATHLTDTGSDLKLSELIGDPGTSPAQLAAAMVAMQKLEGKISKAEAEAAVEVIVTVNAPEISVSAVSDDAKRSTPNIAGAQLSLRLQGDWMHLDDRELDVDYERWSPGTLLVGFGAFGNVESRRASPKQSASTLAVRARAMPGATGIHTIAIAAQGNEEMLDRVVKETRWEALAALMKH